MIGLLDRLDAHVDAAMRDPRGAKDIHIIPLPPLDDANARWAILRAIKTARMNEFWHHTRVSRPKLLTVIERLDASKGRDFDTVQGSLTILDLLEEVTPTARAYFSFATIHEAQDSGNFPKLVQRLPPPAPN